MLLHDVLSEHPRLVKFAAQRALVEAGVILVNVKCTHDLRLPGVKALLEVLIQLRLVVGLGMLLTRHGRVKLASHAVTVGDLLEAAQNGQRAEKGEGIRGWRVPSRETGALRQESSQARSP